MNIYKCEICGNILEMIEDSGVTPSCCNQTMTKLNGEIKELKDEHYIEYFIKNYDEKLYKVNVCIGKENLHPMTMDHRIMWITIRTNMGIYTHFFDIHDVPCASFFLRKQEKIVSLYAYCDKHRLYVKRKC